MRFAILAGLGLVAVLLVVIGGGVHWFWHVQSIDLTDPQAVSKMHDLASTQCQASAQQSIASHGVALTQQMQNAVRHFCDCNADGDVQILERQKSVTISDINALAENPEARDVARHCAAQIGITMQ